MASVSYFGIRHHGPGSARRLVEALDDLAPVAVLIEGPADASDLLPMLADPAMQLPVALLTYAEDDPGAATFFPFAVYSPEYQAAIWAVRHGAALRFIDLPASDRRGEDEQGSEEDPVSRDPIGALATAAGYADGESWWSDTIEENTAPGPVFAAVGDAMTALRTATGALSVREAAREAHMRLEIARAMREIDGSVAVVCGAWHVPALVEKHSITADRERLRGRPKAKIKATWAPWTAPRLARASGYGAGVVAPGWCEHLWTTPAHRETVWLTRIARLLRERGHGASTASVIEAERLALALAHVRERPAPGFEELRDAAVACLCHGERLLWEEIAAELLIGSAVGSIPPSTPLAPLLEDLQRQQKAVRLKPEALERDLTLDLRSEAGLARSTLLHRLQAIDVPWGRLADAGRSRGTFRENWRLCWEPEFAVRLVEQLVHGATIAEAAAAPTIEAMCAEPDLARLAELVRTAMLCQLDVAVEFGLAALDRAAALTSACSPLLGALPPMADLVRYGQARAGAMRLAELLPRITVQAALALPYAARGLDDAAAAALRAGMLAADAAIELAELDADVTAAWRDALTRLAADDAATRLVAGVAARLLYAADWLSAGAAADLLARMLSPGTPVGAAASFFEGFFDGAGQRLIHDAPLRVAVDAWLIGLDGQDFVTHLPLFRRVFAGLDASERRRLMDGLFGRAATGAGGYRLIDDATHLWPAHFDRVVALLDAGAPQ